MRTVCDVVEHGEGHESHNHHLEEFQIMIADEAKRLFPVPHRLSVDVDKLCRGIKMWLCFIFQYQSVCAQEEEYWYAIMSEE